MQGGLVVPASMGGCPVPMHGTSTVQLQGLPWQDVVVASCGVHTFVATGEGVVVKPPGQPKPEPDELPELLDPELLDPELLDPELLEPEPELDPEPESPEPGEGEVCPPQAITTASIDAPTMAFFMPSSLRQGFLPGIASDGGRSG